MCMCLRACALEALGLVNDYHELIMVVDFFW